MVEEHAEAVLLYRARGENALTLDTHTLKRRYPRTTPRSAGDPREPPRGARTRDPRPAPDGPDDAPYITDRDELFDEVASIRERGIAACAEERVEGLQCAAAPILSTDDRVLGAISVADRPRASLPNAFRRRSRNSSPKRPTSSRSGVTFA